MKVKQLYRFFVLLLLFIPTVIFAQPNLGTMTGFSLFTSTGDVSNTGSSQIIGDLGTNFGSITGFGNINGTMHDSDGSSAQGAVDLAVLYNDLNTAVATFFPAAALGNGQVLTPGVYSIATGATLTNDLTLDAQGDPNAVFIIRINGTFTAAAGSEVILLDGALACNVFWQVEGDIAIGPNSVIKGNLVANNADIDIDAAASLEGRALATAGTITIDDVLAYTPAGCGAPLLNGPPAPNLLSAACYALLAVDDNMSNTGVSIITGEVGSDNGASVGFDPLFISGTLHLASDASTSQAATDFMNAYTYASSVSPDIEIMFPAQLGNGLILTPHTYVINASATLSDTLFIDAQNNSTAVFLIQVNGDLITTADSRIVLLNGADSDNIYWEVDGNVTLGDNSVFRGTIMGNNGAINISAGAEVDGRVLATNGAININTTTVTIPTLCSPEIIDQPIDQTVCAGNDVSFSVNATGAGLTYQWRRGTVDLVDGGNISGATTATLTITNVSAADDATDYNVVVSGDYEPAATSDNTALVVNTAPAITIQPNDEVVCIGDAADFTVTATGTGLTYQWMRGGMPLTDAGSVSGTTTATLVIDPVDALDAATDYSVVVSGTCPSSMTSVDVVLTVNSPIAISTQPTDQVICEGNSVSFSVIASGSGLTYQWTRGGVNLTDGGNISGATGATLTINPAGTADAATDYNVIVSGACPSMTSVDVELTVNEAPAIVTQPIDQVVCEGSPVTFTVVATGTGLTYQWRRAGVDLADGGNISGSSTSTLTINPITEADEATNYSVEITGTCPSTVTSVDAGVVVNGITAISVQPSDQSVCEGSAVNMTVSASGAGLTYQWTRGGINLSDGGSISGATSATLNINPVAMSDAATDYNVIVSGACGAAVTSIDAELAVNEVPVITTQPLDQVVCEGSSVTFTVVATGTGLTYQWRRAGVDLADGGNISGATTASLTINPIAEADEATNYSVEITGACPVTVTSVDAGVIVNGAPVITVQPIDEAVCETSIVNMAVTATGSGLTYQWRRGTTNLTDVGTVSGSATSILTISPVALSDAGTDYNVIVTGACGSSVTSIDAELTVNTAPEITIEPVDQTVCEGGSISFTVTASGQGLTYQWYKGTLGLADAGSVSGVTTPTLTINPVNSIDAGTDYNVIVTGICPTEDTSVNVSLSINTPPVITSQPNGETVCPGETATYTVGATGTGLTYQWMRGGVALVDGGNISGVNTATLTLSPATPADVATDYTVVVSGSCPAPVTSVDVGLTINSAPAITGQPANQTTCDGSVAVFTVTATGTGLTYQWMRGGVALVDGGNISGATTAVLTINPATAADEGTDYTVMISGACPSPVTSSDAALFVNDLTSITLQPTDQQVCEGNSVSFTVTASGTALTYQWTRGGVNLVDGGNISGATTATLTINPAMMADAFPDYNVTVSGACPATTSADVELTVNTAPVITVQPTDQTYCEGSSATLNVTATGTGLTYQWMRGGVALVDGGSISGATTASLNINPVTTADAAADYSVMVSGACPAAVTSVDVALIINTAPVITVQPVDLTVCEGSAATFTVTATGSGLTYQWMKGGVGLVDNGTISGVTTATLTIDPTTTADGAPDYSVMVSGACPAPVTSLDVMLVINTSPAITVQPSDETVCDGSPATFIVTATGGNLNYQWRIGTTNLVDGGNISGATTSTLTINPATTADEASNYNVVITGSCPGTATSANVALEIEDVPVITVQPTDQSVCEGSAVSFTVTSSTPGVTYQWRRGTVNVVDGGNISGATTATLTFNPANSIDAASNYNVVVSGSCPANATSVDVSLTVNTPPVISVQPTDQSACPGEAVSFDVTASGNGITYQWMQGATTLTDGGNISGATTATLTIDPVAVGDAASDYHVVITGACPAPATSVDVALIINNSPVITVQPVNMSVCEGNSVSFNVTAAGSGLTYQWMRGSVALANGGNISGATTSTLTINPAMTADAGTDYNVVITGACPTSTTSANVSLTINTAPVITVQPLDQTVCEGSSLTFSVTATGTGLTYQWRRAGVNLTDGGNISGTTTSSLTINPIAEGDEATNYSVIISGTCPSPVTSFDAGVIVNNSPVISVQPVDMSVCEGSSATFSVGATGTGLTYQWMLGGSNLADGGNISGATTATLTINPVGSADAATDYSVMVSGACPSPATSADVELSIIPTPAITIQPADETVCEGSAASFSVTATGVGLTYQWMRGGVALVDGGNISGATTSTLTINPAMEADEDTDYSVMITGTCPVTSANAELTVNQGPPITVQPLDQTVCPGGAVSFSVTASGPVLSFQWMRAGIPLVNGGNISGATTSTLTIDPASIADVGTDYSVVVSGGGCSTASADVALSLDQAPAITGQPANQTVCDGSTAVFTVTASGTGLTYQWMRGGVALVDGGNISGATTAALTIDPATSADAGTDYTVMVSGTCPSPVISSDAALFVDPATTITVQPANQSVCEGNSVSFSVSATGTGLTYQWMRGGVNLADGGNISGATTSTLTINPAMTADAGTDYSVLISGACPAVASANVTLNVNTAPVITVLPVDQTVCEGSSVTFTVVATGSGLTYQWRRGTTNMTDNVTVSGSTTASMTIAPVGLSDEATNYNVVITGTCPSAVTSANIALTIEPSPIITVQPLAQTVCEGSAASFTVTASGSGLTYQWRRGATDLVNGGNISGATGTTLTIDPATAADAALDYNVVVTGTCPATSVNVALNISTAPVITAQPLSQTLCPGGTATFGVTATGSNLSYQWTFNGSNLVDGGSYSGSTTATMTIDPVDASHVGNSYNVVITGSCPSPVTSANATLSLDTIPSITVQSADQTVCEGSPATFAITAEGSGLAYQWRRGTTNLANGGSISGATTSSLTINPATASDEAANYNVVVTGSCPGSTTSADYSLVVNEVPDAVASGNTDLCVGTDIVLTAETVSGASYSWTGPDGFTSSSQNPVISSATTANSGTYTLTVTNNTCSASSDVAVVVNNDCDIVAVSIPEGFSPNGDNVNDILVIDGIEGYSDNKFMIFNRWGDEVFEGDSYMNTWDGKGPNGEILPVGVYFYILDLGDGSEDKKGTIYLNK